MQTNRVCRSAPSGRVGTTCSPASRQRKLAYPAPAHGSRSIASAASLAASSGVFMLQSFLSAFGVAATSFGLHYRRGGLPAISLFLYQRRFQRRTAPGAPVRSETERPAAPARNRPRADAAAGSLFCFWLLLRAVADCAPPASLTGRRRRQRRWRWLRRGRRRLLHLRRRHYPPLRATGAKDCRGVSEGSGKRHTRVKRQRIMARHFNARASTAGRSGARGTVFAANQQRLIIELKVAGRHRRASSRIVAR